MIESLTVWVESLPNAVIFIYLGGVVLASIGCVCSCGVYNDDNKSLQLSVGSVVSITFVVALLWPILLPRYILSCSINDAQKFGKLPKSFDHLQEIIHNWFRPTGDKDKDAQQVNKKLSKAIYVVSAVLWTFMILIKLSLFM